MFGFIKHEMKRFGRPLAEASLVDGVPDVLRALWDQLLSGGGLTKEGIFRLSADEVERVTIKRRLNQAMPVEEAAADASAICCAALIKAYLRELPDDLWREVRPHLDHLLQNGDGDGALSPAELLQYLPSPERETLYWLCDCANEVAQHEASNKMSGAAIAVVLHPGPFPPPIAVLLRPGLPHLTFALAPPHPLPTPSPPHPQPPLSLSLSLSLPPGARAQSAAVPSRRDRPDGRVAAHTDVGQVHENTARHLSRRVTIRLVC